MASHNNTQELEKFRLIVESDESDSSTTDLVRDRSPRSSKRTRNGRLFCDHCNQWLTKSTFYRHKVYCANEQKKESDEDSTGDILQDISNDVGGACVTEHNEAGSDEDSIDDVLEDMMANDMEGLATVSQRGDIELSEPDSSINEEFQENSWLIEV